MATLKKDLSVPLLDWETDASRHCIAYIQHIDKDNILIYEYIILKNLNLSYSAVLRFSKFYFTVTAYSNSINSYSSRNLVSAITVRLIY